MNADRELQRELHKTEEVPRLDTEPAPTFNARKTPHRPNPMHSSIASPSEGMMCLRVDVHRICMPIKGLRANPVNSGAPQQDLLPRGGGQCAAWDDSAKFIASARHLPATG